MFLVNYTHSELLQLLREEGIKVWTWRPFIGPFEYTTKKPRSEELELGESENPGE